MLGLSLIEYFIYAVPILLYIPMFHVSSYIHESFWFLHSSFV